MNSKPVLKLDWCSHEAAKYAVEKWHYSQRMPAAKNVYVGVWEDSNFIGAIIFGRGANRNMSGEFGLACTQCCELTRVAMTNHLSPVSRIVQIAIKLLRMQSPGLKLIVSYADPDEGHVGGIYQAMGWVYIGQSRPQKSVIGMHKRSAFSRFGTISGQPKTEISSKHKYLMPLDAEMRAKIAPLAKPYLKRVRSVDSDTPGVQPGMGGANPTRTLSDGAGATDG